MNLRLSDIPKFIRSLRSRGWSATMHKVRGKLGQRRALADDYKVDIPVDPRQQPVKGGLRLPDPTDSPIVSIIVPVYNQWQMTWNCLSTLVTACQRHTFEVILADDNSDDETKISAKSIANLIVVRDNINRRFLRNCNNAAQRARGEVLFFLNNDTKCAPHAIDILVEHLRAHPRAGIVGSKLLYEDGLQQECGGILWSDGTAENYGCRQRADLPGFLHPRQVDYVSGAALMIRHDLWKEIGGFDDRFAPAYYEDADLSMTVRAKGWQVWVQPSSQVIHYEGRSHGTDTTTGLKAYQVRNAVIFKEKWASVLSREHWPPGIHSWNAATRPMGVCTILVIDHYLPAHDQDAGSVCIRHYLESLAALGHRVIFIGDNFVRTEPYATQLEALGIEVMAGNWYANHWQTELQSRADTLDIIIYNRPHITQKYIGHIRRIAPNAVHAYFGVDLHFIREERAAAVAPESERGALLAQAALTRQQEAAIYKEMDVALSISADEARQIATAFSFSHTEVFPGFIYPSRQTAHPIPGGNATVMFVGGFAHAPNADAVDWFIESIWPEVRKRIPNAQFWIVGSNMPDRYSYIGNGVEALGRLSDADLLNRYAQCHAVVAPLRFGAGLKGKVVQALAEGVPIVTTHIGIEGLPHDTQELLRGYNTASDFADRVCTLCIDAEENLFMRTAQLDHSKIHFSRQSSIDFFKSFCERHRKPLRWIYGHFSDGWLGPESILRVTPGAYCLMVWVPPFQFKVESTALRVTVYLGESIADSKPMTEAGIIELKFASKSLGFAKFVTSRSLSPRQSGLGDDQRQLSVKLISLTHINNQAP